MVLVRGNHVADVCAALDLCRVIFARIQWNFLWSLVYNCLGIPVAAGLFFPIFHTRLPPTVAALAMALSSVSVVFSSLALRLYRPPVVGLSRSTTSTSTSAAVAASADGQTSSQGTRPAPQQRRGPQLVTSLSLDTSAGRNSDLTQPLLANEHPPNSAGVNTITASMEEGRAMNG